MNKGVRVMSGSVTEISERFIALKYNRTTPNWRTELASKAHKNLELIVSIPR
jgi:hypothetical protein